MSRWGGAWGGASILVWEGLELLGAELESVWEELELLGVELESWCGRGFELLGAEPGRS